MKILKMSLAAVTAFIAVGAAISTNAANRASAKYGIISTDASYIYVYEGVDLNTKSSVTDYNCLTSTSKKCSVTTDAANLQHPSANVWRIPKTASYTLPTQNQTFTALTF